MTDDMFESELITITDENGENYYLFVPENIDEMDVNDPDYGYIILESVFEGDEEVFLSIEDDEELQEVYEMFMALMVDEDEGFDEEFDEQTIQEDLNQ